MHGAKAKTVFILPSFAGGGAERVLITLMNGLDANRFDRAFVAVSGEGPLRDLIDPAIPVTVLGENTSVFRSVFRLYKALKFLKPDIVISTMAHMNFVLLVLRPFFPKTRFVVREAITPSYFFQDKGLKQVIVWGGYKVLYPFAHLVISPAQLIIGEFRDVLHIAIKNHVFMPNPVDVENLRKGKPERADARLQFICSGRLDRQKGFDRLIEILPQLAHQDWHLTIMGEGQERTFLEARIAELGLKDHITLKGFVETPGPYIGGADVFLLPSRYEGLPNVVLEALACGTPVISMREAGGIEEIAHHATPGDVQVVKTMEEFTSAMNAVQVQPAAEFRPSLLPDVYKKENVIVQFSQILLKDRL